MRVLGLVPARGGSKGVPRKNIKLLGGVPLICYTAESAKKATRLTNIVLSTDDQEIAEVGLKCGLEVPFIRPAELAVDSTPAVEVIAHALIALAKEGREYDAVCLLQVTTPFREDGLIDNSIDKFARSDVDSLVSVRRVPHTYNPHWTFKTTEENILVVATGDDTIITRRQELPVAYYRDGLIYLVRSSIVMSSGSMYGHRISFIETQSERYVNIDSIDDWAHAERLIRGEN